MDELPDFVGGGPASAPEALAADLAPASAPAVETAAPEGAPPAADAAPAAPGAPVAPEVPPAHVPITALLDERERRQASERQAAEATREINELRSQEQRRQAEAQRRPIPDRDQDPDGYQAYRDAQIQDALHDQRLDLSRFRAEQEHGKDLVQTAYDWGFKRCAEDPHFNAKVAASADPVSVVVAEYKRDQIATTVDPNDYQGYLAWKAAGAQPGGAPIAAPAAPPPAPVAPRQSLAGGPSAGSSAAPEVRDGAAQFDAMFK